MKTRTSTAYEFTVQLVDGQPVPADAERINQLKQHIKWYNQRVKKESTSSYPDVGNFKLRIKLQGRLGPNNPAAAKYRGRLGVNLSDATYADVYTYRRIDY